MIPNKDIGKDVAKHCYQVGAEGANHTKTNDDICFCTLK